MRHVFDVSINVIRAKRWKNIVKSLFGSEYTAILFVRDVVQDITSFGKYHDSVKEFLSGLNMDEVIACFWRGGRMSDFIINPSPESLKRLNAGLNGILQIKIQKRVVHD